MITRKKYITFISYAEPDRQLAENISRLFDLLDHQAYIASDNLPKAGTSEWRHEIIRAIRSCHSFLPVYTHHSVRRPWVLYESGVADSAKLTRFPARASCITPTTVDFLPSGSALSYDLSDKRALASLITNICLLREQHKSEVTSRVKRIFSQHTDIVDSIITYARTRFVFIAGNAAENAQNIPWYSTKIDYEARLRTFVEILSETLLQSGFSIAACPQVHSVGMHVTRKVLDCMDTQGYDRSVSFRIAGIYPIDRDARDIKLSDSAKNHWLKQIMAFRRSYLADQEWLVLLGGNAGSNEEYVAAREIGLKIFAIPCFGGTAAAIHRTIKSVQINPCKGCKTQDGMCGINAIRQIVECLKQPCV